MRSKLKSLELLLKQLTKIEGLSELKANALNFESNGVRYLGSDITAFDLTSDEDKITFTHNAINYEILKSDLTIIKRIRSRKYLIEAKVITVVV
jgi:hypothetical protein